MQAALAIRQARLTEATMNLSIQQDSANSELSDFWTLPDFQSFKFYSGRLAFLAAESQLWARVPRDEFTRCLRYFLQLVQRPPSTDVFSWDIQPSVLVSFCQAIVTVKLPYDEQHSPQGMQHTDGGTDAVKPPYWVSSRVAEFFALAMRRSA